MKITNITSATLKNWLENNEAILIDVREIAENKSESIAGSTLIPLGEINSKILPKSTNKKLVIHCRSGKRSLAACEKIVKEDASLEVYNLEGGIISWINSGFAVKKSDKFFLPLDRQVQLTIGLAVLAGSLLGYFVDSKFFILSGFFGAGLCFAAITGWCGLAMFLAKMPWNKSDKNTSFCSIKK
jgi:rhodanese-related sulfurtransferase